MQRDVEVDFESVDKTGGFIGGQKSAGFGRSRKGRATRLTLFLLCFPITAMYVDKAINVAVELVRAGLATVHGFSAESLPYGKQLQAAEDDAKRNKRNVSRLPFAIVFLRLS